MWPVAPPPLQVIHFFKSPSIKIKLQRIWDPCGSHMGLQLGLLSSQARSKDFFFFFFFFFFLGGGAVVSTRSVRSALPRGWVQGGGCSPPRVKRGSFDVSLIH